MNTGAPQDENPLLNPALIASLGPENAGVTFFPPGVPPTPPLTPDGKPIVVPGQYLITNERYLEAHGTDTHDGTLVDYMETWTEFKTIAFNAPDGAQSVTINGTELIGLQGTVVITSNHGKLEAELTVNQNGTGSLTYRYLLEERLEHDNDNGYNITTGDGFILVVTDVDGDSASIDINVVVVDDVPVIIADWANVDNGVSSVDGNVLTNDDFGADGQATNYMDWLNADGDVSIVFTDADTNAEIVLTRDPATGQLTDAASKKYGVLELNADGDYVYTKSAGGTLDGDIVVAYTVEDADGDRVSSTLTITVKDSGVTITPPDPEDPPVTTPEGEPININGQDLVADESTLEAHGADTHDGTQKDDVDTWTAAKTITFDAPDGVDSVVVEGTTLINGQETLINGTYGQLSVTLTLNQDGTGGTLTYKYLLLDRLAHDDADGHNVADGDSFSVVVTDVDGDDASIDINVVVIDDVPVVQAVADPTDTLTWNDGANHYNAETGAVEFNYGADGFALLIVTDKDDATKTISFTAPNTKSITYEDGSVLSVTLDNDGNATYSYTPGDETATENRSYRFTGTDGDGDPVSQDIDVAVEIHDPGTMRAVLEEPEIVPWMTGTGAANAAEGDLSNNSVVLNLDFPGAAGENVINVTITAPGGGSITFTTDGSGQMLTEPSGPLDGEWGRLSYNSGSGQWVYAAFNKADRLNPNDDLNTANRDAHGNGLDNFVISAEGGQSGAPIADPQTLAVTINAHDDIPVFVLGKPVTHDQPSQVLGPYIDGATSSLSGVLNIMDIDDNDKDITFYFRNPATGDYELGTRGGTDAEPTWTFQLQYGYAILEWVPAGQDIPDAGNIPGNEAGAWKYTYQFENAPKNMGLRDDINIRAANPIHDPGADGAYDPADPSTWTATIIPVNLVTTDFVPGDPRPVYDILHFYESGNVTFNNSTTAGDSIMNNVLDNDRTINGALDAAEWNGMQWVLQPGVSVLAASGATDYGSWSLSAGGVFNFTLDANSAMYKALPLGETVILTLPYTMMDNGRSYTSYVMVEIEGRNDPPQASNVLVNLTPGWAQASINETEDLAGLALISDPDRGDTLSFRFYHTDGTTPLEMAPGGLDGDFFETPRAAEGFFFDADKDGENGVRDVVNGQAVYRADHGWIVLGADGKYRYVVDRADEDVIRLRGGETLTETVKFEVVDAAGASSGIKEIKVTIIGSFDPLSVHALDESTIRSGSLHIPQMARYFHEETLYLGNGPETKAVLSYGMDRGVDIGPDGTLAAGAMDIPVNNTHAGEGGSRGDLGFGDLRPLVEVLDGSGSQTVYFGFDTGGPSASSTCMLYGRNEETGEIQLLGTLVMMNPQLSFYPVGEGVDDRWSNAWKLNGTYAEFFTDEAGAMPLRLIAWTSDNPAATRTPIDVDFVLRFENDSPVVQGVRLSLDNAEGQGKVVFFDVDSKPEDLSLWVEDPADSSKLVRVDADNTEITYSHGTLHINRDGSFTYETSDTSANRNIRVAVSDGNSASEGLITIEQAAGGGSTAVLKDDVYRFHFTSNNILNKYLPPVGEHNGLFGNDTGATNEVLNAGTYMLSNMVITATDADKSSYQGTDAIHGLGGGRTVSGLFHMPEDSRFEICMAELTMNIESNGQVLFQISPYFKVYDKVTDSVFYIDSAKLTPCLAKMSDMLNMTEDEIRDALRVTFNYQSQDANTGELVEGNLVLDLGHSFENGSQYYNVAVTNPATVSLISVSSVFDRFGDADGQGHSHGVTSGGIRMITDLDADDLYFRFATLDANGVPAWPPAWTSVRDLVPETRPTDGWDKSVVAENPTSVEGVPLYAWVNTNTGQVASAKGTGDGWVCLQVGDGALKPYIPGDKYLLGYDSDDNVIDTTSRHILDAYVTVNLFTLENSPNEAAMQMFLDYVRNLTEGQKQNLIFFRLDSSDDPTGQGRNDENYYTNLTGKDILINIEGSDVILGDNNQAINKSAGEAAVTGTGLGAALNFLDGAKHTVINGSGQVTGGDGVSASRLDPDGWAGIDFGANDPTPGVTDFPAKVYGQYGMLVRGLDPNRPGEYIYKAYDPDDMSLTPEQRNAGKAVLGLVNGQQLVEVFNFTAYDKNGEHDTGQMRLTINGRSDGFSIHVTPPEVTEGEVLSSQLSEAVSSHDAGTVTYYIKYTDGQGQVYDSEVSGSGGATEVIHTPYGTLTLTPSSGGYTFRPNGILQHGQDAVLDIQIKAVLVSNAGGTTVTQDSGWQDYDITVHGVNDKPILPVNYGYAAANSTELWNALAWDDIDNNKITQAGKFHIDVWRADNNDHGTPDAVNASLIHLNGLYGELQMVSDQGAFLYTTDPSAFDTSTHRVTETFKVSVTDPGSDGLGDHAATSDGSDLHVFAVDGGLLFGTAGNDTLTGTAGKGSILEGGQGNDTLNVSSAAMGQNVLVWNEGDEANNAVDTIIGFHGKGQGSAEGDILDLRGLVEGYVARDVISWSVAGNDVHISVAVGADTQQIILQGAGSGLGLAGDGGYDELVAKVTILTNS
jgi:VCBS repeat-containing protein